MSSDVHPQIRKQSHAEANAEFDAAQTTAKNAIGRIWSSSIGMAQTSNLPLRKICDFPLTKDWQSVAETRHHFFVTEVAE
jgi:hypothetical protein